MALHDLPEPRHFDPSVRARRPLRILMVSARYFPFMGGIETHVHEVGARLVALGHSVDVLTTDPSGELPSSEKIGGMQVFRVRAWPARQDLYLAPRIYSKLSEHRWDIVHIQGCSTFVAPLALMAAIRARIRFVLTFHSGGHSSRLRLAMRRLQHALLRPMISRAHQLIAVSQFEAQFFSRRMRLPRERFTVILNGAHMPRPTHGNTLDQNCLVVSIGRLERYKGHHRAIAAMPELIRRVPEAQLRIVGEGPYEPRLRRLVDRLGLQDRVVIGGIPPHERQAISNLLASARLVVLLSAYEAHPIAIMEALSLGRPVLVSNTSGLRELAQQGLCRSISLNSSASEVAKAMAGALQGDQQVPVSSLPTWDRCTRDLLRIYERVADAGI